MVHRGALMTTGCSTVMEPTDVSQSVGGLVSMISPGFCRLVRLCVETALDTQACDQAMLRLSSGLLTLGSG